MKKFILGCLIGVSLTCTSAVFASDIKLEVYKVATSIFLNGQSLSIPEEYSILNYNGHTYVPLRYLSETIGSDIKYDHESDQIDVQFSNFALPVQSAISGFSIKDNFTLKINSEKGTYKQGEKLNIWSSFVYEGDREVTIVAGLPFLHYFIKDNEGHYYEEAEFQYMNLNKLGENTEFLYVMPSRILQMFYYQNSDLVFNDYIDELKIDTIPKLKPGNYTIGVRAYYNTNFQQSSEITIKIE